VGRVLNDRYHLLNVIGTGGMSTVYRARDSRLGREVAIKILHPQFARDKAFIERFSQEAEFAASLSAHPNIVSIYDVGEDGELSYIVMELVEGRNLKDLILSEGPLTVDRAFGIGQSIASALSFAHQRGLVHRDIKPQNVLVSPDGTVRVTDFGIARSSNVADATRTGVVLGTAHYLSPEQAQGHPAEARSDIYALAVVLFEMVTGRLLFEADNPLGIAMRHVHDAPPAPSAINPTVPPWADAVILRGLNKNPADRYRSAAEFGMAMQRRAVPDVGQTTVISPVVPPVMPQETMVIRREQPAPPTVTRTPQEISAPNPWKTTLLILGGIALVAAAAAASFLVYRATINTTTRRPTATIRPTPAHHHRATATPIPRRTHIPTVTPTQPPPTPTPTPTTAPSPTPTPTPTPTSPPTPTTAPSPLPSPSGTP